MWTFVGGGGADPPYRYYEFRTNRNHEHALTTLKRYRGLLHSDKYGVYEALAQKDGIVWCPCMAHVRRKFVEAEGGDPALRRNVVMRRVMSHPAGFVHQLLPDNWLAARKTTS